MKITPEFATEFNKLPREWFGWARPLEISDEQTGTYIYENNLFDKVEDLIEYIYFMGTKYGEKIS